MQQVGFEKINSKKPCGEIDNNVEYAKIEFNSKYTELNEYFIDILQIFGVSPFTQVWKNRQGRYEFYEDEIKFFCELLYRYAECDIWKKIRKVQNLFFDGFIRIYEESDGYKLLQELIFVVNGFFEIYNKRTHGNTEKVEYFRKVLYIHTQVLQIRWMEGMKVAIFNIATLGIEDINYSLSGSLLEDYQDYLDTLKVKVDNVIKEENKKWKETLRKEREYFEKIKTMKLQEEAIDALIKEFEKIEDEEIRAEIMSTFGESANEYQRDVKQMRKFNEQVRKEIIKAWERLPEYQAEKIAKIFVD